MCFLHDIAAISAVPFALGTLALRRLTGRLRAVRIPVLDQL
jgi:hypothetical protein